MNKRKKLISVLAGIMAGIMLLGLLLSMIPVANAASSSEIRNQINELKDQQEELQTMMEDLQKTLMQEIQYRRKLIRWLAAQRDEVMRAEQAGDRCMIEHQSALHCCIYMVDDTLVDKQGEERKQFKAWLQALPFANVCYIGGVGETAYSCLVLTEEEAARSGARRAALLLILFNEGILYSVASEASLCQVISFR